MEMSNPIGRAKENRTAPNFKALEEEFVCFAFSREAKSENRPHMKFSSKSHVACRDNETSWQDGKPLLQVPITEFILVTENRLERETRLQTRASEKNSL